MKKQTQYGPLEAIVRPGTDPSGPCIVLFHGYGASCEDLYPLSQVLSNNPNVTWVFPNAPHRVPLAPGWEGRAWWPIRWEELEKGGPKALLEAHPEGMDESAEMARQLLQELHTHHSHLIWGGFSQGAMLSTELAMTTSFKPTALMLLSGALLDKSRWQKLAQQRAPIHFFQSHGTHDPVLSHGFAEALFSLLKQAGWQGEFHGFPGEHEIPPPVIQDLFVFLKKFID